MIKRILCVLALTSVFSANAKPTDEEACAHLLGDLTQQMTNAHVDEMKQLMTVMLVNAYRRFGAPIQENQIIYSVPVTTNVQPSFMTELTAKVDAGPNAIMAQGVSSFLYKSVTERVNETDDLGRITGSKLVCSLIGEDYAIQLINATTKQVIDSIDTMPALEITIELP